MNLKPNVKKTLQRKEWKLALRCLIEDNFDSEIRREIYKGDGGHCNFCELDICDFFPWRDPKNEREICPICYSHVRHRFFKYWLDRNKSKLPPDARILHFAPEKSVESALRRIGKHNYLSVDIKEGVAMKVEDMTKLSFDAKSFDMIFCSHVVQHIHDDNKALSELYRVLDTNGTLALISSVTDGSTREIPYECVGHKIYKKTYNVLDLKNQLTSIGFDVELVYARDLIPNDAESLRLRISKYQMMFICIKK